MVAVDVLSRKDLIVGDVGDRGLGSILVVRFIGVSKEGREW